MESEVCVSGAPCSLPGGEIFPQAMLIYLPKRTFCMNTKLVPILISLMLPLTAARRSTTVSYDLSQSGSPVYHDQMQGTCLPVWNSRDLYADIKHGLSQANFSLLRFPNGSMSNDYHWNGKGEYDSTGTWHPDSAVYEPGFVVVSKYRGTSKDHYGYQGYSLILDDDTSSFWWSDPLIDASPAWFYLEFPSAKTVDSLVLVFGDYYGASFTLEAWNGNSNYPKPHQIRGNQWQPLLEVTANLQKKFSASLPSPVNARYYRVVVDSFSHSGKGVQVKELYLYDKGAQITRNRASYSHGSSGQTQVRALGMHHGNLLREDWSSGWVDWDFESFMHYVQSFPYTTQPVICVNYSTGTPEEAARWVHYANKVKGYNIRYWQVGNEMNGDWEEGGPVSATMYAQKYLKFVKAMKAVDPTIKVFGPVSASADFDTEGSGDFNDKSWMQTFIEYVGAHEKEDGVVYVDGIDFHCYPYWYDKAPSAQTMLRKSDYVYLKSDMLLEMITQNLVKPESTLVFMSEYNSSVAMSSMLQTTINGASLANMYGGMVEKFTHRAMSVVWDSYEGGGTGPDGTHGSLSLFNRSGELLHTSYTKPPSAIYWATWIAGSLWLQPSKAQQFIPGEYARNDGIRAYAVTSAGGARILLLNMTLDTLDINLQTANNSFSTAHFYSWSEREFRWNGTDENAWAMPNCGPSSQTRTSAPWLALALPPVSVNVVAFSNDAAPVSSSLLNLTAHRTILQTSDTLHICATARTAAAQSCSLLISIDSSAHGAVVPPLDGAIDGPREAFAVGIAVQHLNRGKHMAYVKLIDATSRSVDSIAFEVKGELRPVVLIDNFEDGNLQCALPGNAAWSKHAHGSNGSSMQLDLPVDSSGNAFLQADFDIKTNATLGYDNFGMITLPFDSGFMCENDKHITGITFRYKTSNSNSAGRFFLHAMSTRVTDYDEYNIPLENSGEWRTVTAAWEEFNQYGWGVKAGPLETCNIYKLELRVAKEGSGIIALDNIAFLGDSGDAIAMPIERGSKAVLQAAPARLSVFCSAGHVRFCIPGTEERRKSIAIYDVHGRIVHFANVGHRNYSLPLQTHASNLNSSGPYLAVAKSNGVIIDAVLFNVLN
ncbi:MAG: hypothetical protein GF398_00170 [Chitinivibrionales bacterium]|nr:hypothetical protein [Chitinivibrionales bacterium]